MGNRQQFIYYNLDKLRHERQEMQKQIRTNIIPKRQVIISNKTTEEEESKEIDVMVNDNECKAKFDEDIIANQEEEEDEEEEEEEEESLVSITESVSKADDDVSFQSSLPLIDEQKEEQQDEVSIDKMEQERLEREKFEQDLMEDYTQSESFAGIDCVQDDFLLQYQKHIENMNKR